MCWSAESNDSPREIHVEGEESHESKVGVVFEGAAVE